jgi:hypothetical protein
MVLADRRGQGGGMEFSAAEKEVESLYSLYVWASLRLGVPGWDIP